MNAEKVLIRFIAVTCILLLLVMTAVALSGIRFPKTETFSAAIPVPVFTPAPPTGPLDPHSVSMEEMDALHGIGPATAQAYLDYLSHGYAFHFPEDLMNVKGIGEKKYADIIHNFHFTLPVASPSPLFE